MLPLKEIYKPYNISEIEQVEKKAAEADEILTGMRESIDCLNESLQNTIIKMKRIKKDTSQSEKNRKLIYLSIALFTVLTIGATLSSKKI